MDIVRAFEERGLTGGGITINIQGTPEDPLFQANQIGALLGFGNIRDATKGFDEDELRVGTTDTSRTANFLTEAGLYRLLFMSRKPLARPFRNWVVKVVREIRLTGKYEVEQQSRIALAAQEAEHRLALEAAHAETAAKEAEAAAKEAEAAAALAAKDAELARFRAKTYEQVPCLDNTYLRKDAAHLGDDILKLGKAIDDSRREAQLNTGSADGGKMVHVRANSNGKLVEDVAKHALKRYHHAREHYSCRLEHAVDVIDIAAIVVDALASSYEFIERTDLVGRVIEQLDALRVANPTADEPPSPTCQPQQPTPLNAQDTPQCDQLQQFIDEHYVRTTEYRDKVLYADFKKLLRERMPGFKVKKLMEKLNHEGLPTPEMKGSTRIRFLKPKDGGASTSSADDDDDE